MLRTSGINVSTPHDAIIHHTYRELWTPACAFHGTWAHSPGSHEESQLTKNIFLYHTEYFEVLRMM